MEMLELKSFYQGKRVFLTGHTGFKGAWAVLMLRELGAEVCAYSLAPDNTRGNLFIEARIDELIESHIGDLSELARMQQIMQDFQPDIVLHLAAQAIVLTSYEEPVSNFAANAQGTVHLLESVRHCPSCRAVVCITTDKCYENKEWHWPYREDDQLGGKDPYSASKAMAEIAIASYRRSFFEPSGVACASARAGNVIGGGDYAAWRIMPDIAESLHKQEQIVLRNPLSIRPWQHVMDAIYGYLVLAMKAYQQPECYAKAYNFAPFKSAQTYTVQAVTEIYLDALALSRDHYRIEARPDYKPESTLLQLDASLALAELGWQAQLSVPEAIELTATWFDSVLSQNVDALTLTQKQVRDFFARL